MLLNLLLLSLCLNVGSEHLLRHMASHGHGHGKSHSSKALSYPTKEQQQQQQQPNDWPPEVPGSTPLGIIEANKTRGDASSSTLVFHESHNCSKHGLTVRDIRQWNQLLLRDNMVNNTDGSATVPAGINLVKESYLTITTVLGGWVQLDQVQEWIFWHYYVVGADKFVFYLINAEARLRKLLETIRYSHGIDIRLTTVSESKMFWDAANNNVRIMKRISNIFSRAVKMERELSEWLACIDIDEFIAPGTATPSSYTSPELIGQTFVSWLRALPAEVDWVYLRWVWHPVDDYTDAKHYWQQKFFSSAVTHTYTSRVSDAAVKPLQEANSGKSIVKPALFDGENSIHHFTPRNPGSYDSKKRKAVPSTREPVLPKSCNSWETGGRRRPQACRRVEDSFVLNHYRRRSFTHRPRDDTVRRPMDLDDKFLVDAASPALCASVAVTCSLLATDRTPILGNGTGGTLEQKEGLFSLRNESAGETIAPCLFSPRGPLRKQQQKKKTSKAR